MRRPFTIAFAVLTLLFSGVAGAQKPTHVVIIFDMTRSYWGYLHVAYAVTERLLKELYFMLPGHPEDQVTFVALNATPSIVTEVRGLDLRRQAARKFLEAFRSPDPRLGTDVVTAFELAALAFSRNPDTVKFLFAFTDMQVDPTSLPDGRHLSFRSLTAFNWEQLQGVSLWIFFCPAQTEAQLKRQIPFFTTAHFFSPPPLTDGVLEQANLKSFTDRIAQQFQKEIAKRAQAESNDRTQGQFPWVWLLAFPAVGVVLLLAFWLLARLERRSVMR